MRDYLTRSELSNGSLTTKNLIDYAIRHNITELGIVELEVLPEFIKSSNINVYYGVELLSSQSDISLVVYNIKDINNFKEKLNLLYNKEQDKLLNEAIKIFHDNSLFSSLLKEVKVLNIYYVVKMLIKLGYTSNLKSSLKILNNYITENKPDLNSLISTYKDCGDLFIKVNNTDFPNLNISGVIYTGKNNREILDTLIKKCKDYNYKLLLGSNFDNHKIGEVIGL